MAKPGYIKVDDIITRSPHLSDGFKNKYRKEIKQRIREGKE